MKHILIIGGTGMLRKASEYFIWQGRTVSLMARNESVMKALQSQAAEPSRVNIIKQDYTNTKAALQKVEQAMKKHGPVDLAILWIHSSGNDFSGQLKKLLVERNKKVKIFQLLGSAYLNPKKLSNEQWKRDCPENYREVILGFIKEGGDKRWLTDEEISQGTLHAVEKDLMRFVVGTLGNRE